MTVKDIGMTKDLLRTARILSEAVPFIRRYADQALVVKFGGHAMVDPDLAKLFARDIVLMRQVGIRPIVVHGGGPQIDAMLKRLGIKSRTVNGLRVTDAETMEVVEMVLAGSTNKQIVAAINEAGGVAVGLSGKDGGLIRARQHGSGELGLVGEPTAINAALLNTFADRDIIPVIAPIGIGEDGTTYNINADTVAGKIAAAMGAKRLLMLTDVAGVLDRAGTLIPEMTATEARQSIAAGAITGGMIPKVETCLDAVADGVEAAVILDGRIPHVVLLEIFTAHGVGTLIRKAA